MDARGVNYNNNVMWYNEAVEVRRGSFSPFAVSVDGFVGVEASCVLRRVAEVLSWK